MTIEELTKTVDAAVEAGTISADKRIEILDQAGDLQDAVFELSDRLAEIPEQQEDEAQ